MRPVGLCEWKIRNVHPILLMYLRVFLRTFEAEIFKIFIGGTVSLCSKVTRSYKKKDKENQNTIRRVKMGVPEYQLSAKFLLKYQLSAKNLAKYQLSVKIRDN